jgi:hypothetical protein
MIFSRLAILILIFSFSDNIYSQYRDRPQNYSEFEIKGGVGLEQGFNIGLNRYYCKNCNFGFGIGSHFPPKDGAHHFLLNTENNFHLVLTKRTKVELSILFNQQVMFWRYSEPDFKDCSVTFGLNSGCRFTSQSDFGFIFEIGPSITYNIDFERKATSTVTPITKKIQPNFRLLIFQRF